MQHAPRLPFAAYKGDGPYVFVSYAHRDADRVFPEMIYLHSKGINLWYDEGIEVGSEWTESIAEAVSRAARVLFFATGQSAASRQCRNEVNFALNHNIPVVVVYLEMVELSAGMHLSLDLNQAIHQYRFERNDFNARLLEALEAEGAQLVPAADATVIDSIAILPFAVQGGDENARFFAEGLAEDVLNALVQRSTIKVIARASSFRFQSHENTPSEIGRRLSVSHLLQGSVRAAGNRVRLNIQVDSAATDNSVWSERFDSRLENVFDLQDEITARIISSIDSRLLRGVRRRSANTSPEAYNAYLKGIHAISQMQFAACIEYLNQAIALDESFAEAYASLASSYFTLMLWGRIPVADTIPLALRYCDKALALDPEQPRALTVEAAKAFFIDRDNQSSIDQFQRLITRYPSNAPQFSYYAWILSALGQHERAIDLCRRAIEVDPLSPMRYQNLGNSLRMMGHFEESLDAYRKSAEFGNVDYNATGFVAFYRGDTGLLKELSPLIRAQKGEDSWDYRIHRAQIHYLEEDTDAVNRVLDPLRGRNITTYERAVIGRYARDNDESFEHYRRALEERDFRALALLNAAPATRHVWRGWFLDPRYDELLVQAKLDEKTLSSLIVAGSG